MSSSTALLMRLRSPLFALFLGAIALPQAACLVVTSGHESRCDWGDEDCECDDDRGRRPGDRDDRPDMPAGGGTDGGDMTDGDCPADTGEVCGEDGVTYPTPCAASRAHVRVAYEGACGAPCAADSECEVGDICADHGHCAAATCDDVSAPVCGADHRTYGNACEARAAHVTVLFDGECPPSCQRDTDCEIGDICSTQGFCVQADCDPVASDDFSQEVCGVDQFTYASACLARASHIQVAHEGCCY